MACSLQRTQSIGGDRLSDDDACHRLARLGADEAGQSRNDPDRGEETKECTVCGENSTEVATDHREFGTDFCGEPLR